MDAKKFARRINWSYYAIQFTSFASSFAIFLYVTVILQSKGFTSTEIGLTVALGSALSILLPTAIAYVYARIPGAPLKAVVAAVRVVTLVSSVLLIFVDSPVAVVSFIFIVISGTTVAVGSLTNALAMQFESTSVKINFGAARAAGSAGCILMSILTGMISGDTDAIIALSALLLCFCIVLTLVFDTPRKAALLANPGKRLDKTDIPAALPAASSGALRLLRDPKCALFFLVMMLSFANVGVFDTYQLNILKSVGGTDADYGVMLILMVTLETPVMLLFKPLSKRFSMTALMITGFSAMLLKDIALLFAGGTAAVFAMQGFNMLAIGLFSPAQVYFSNSLVGPDETVQAQALFSGTAIATGRILGNLLGGVIIDTLGLHALLIVAAVYAALSIVFAQAADRLHKKSLRAQLEAAG
jgi:PPP family 3-phenylpropionic acid transporter